MKRYLILLATLALLVPANLFAQDLSEEEANAKNLEMIYDAVEQIIERDSKLYNLEDWQVFRIDSVLIHDYQAMIEENKVLKKKGVEKAEYYMAVQDKWFEQIYNAYREILNDGQWAKYLKNGAAKEKKARDRRAAKAAETK